MKRSLNEVDRICRKAAEGAGAPPGLDSDAARGAAFLLARGLPALADLASDLTRFPDLAAACRFDRQDFSDSERTVDAAGRAGAVVAPMLVDLLVARAASNGATGRLRVGNLTSPLFLLPPAVAYADAGRGFRLSLSAGPSRRALVRIARGGGVEILGSDPDVATLFESETAWSLDAVCGADPSAGAEETALARLADEKALDAAYRKSLAQGVWLDPAPWSRLQDLAAKVLVPATAHSQLAGAGARSSDNE